MKFAFTFSSRDIRTINRLAYSYLIAIDDIETPFTQKPSEFTISASESTISFCPFHLPLPLLRNHKPRKEMIHRLIIPHLPHETNILIRAQYHRATLLSIDAIILISPPVTLMIRLIIYENLPVVPPIEVVPRPEHLREVKDSRLLSWSRVHGQHFDERIVALVRGGESFQERVGTFEGLSEFLNLLVLRWAGDVAGEDDEAPAAVALEQFLEMPRSGVCLVEDFEAGHAHADFDVGGEVLLADDAQLRVLPKDLCSVTLVLGVSFFGDDYAGAVVDSCVQLGQSIHA